MQIISHIIKAFIFPPCFYVVFCMVMLVALIRESGAVFGVKLHPVGATTNSQDGVTDHFEKCLPILDPEASAPETCDGAYNHCRCC